MGKSKLEILVDAYLDARQAAFEAASKRQDAVKNSCECKVKPLTDAAINAHGVQVRAFRALRDYRRPPKKGIFDGIG